MSRKEEKTRTPAGQGKQRKQGEQAKEHPADTAVNSNYKDTVFRRLFQGKADKNTGAAFRRVL